MKRALLLFLPLALAAPAAAQSVSPDQQVFGAELPYTLKLKELGPQWRRMRIKDAAPKSDGMDMMKQLMQLGMAANAGKAGGEGGADDGAAAMLGMSLLGSLFGGGEKEDPVSYTRGQTLVLGGETFLVTYRYEAPTLDLAAMAAQAEADEDEDEEDEDAEPDFGALFGGGGKMTEESELKLALVNVRTIGAMTDLRPFDLQKEIEESGKAAGGGLAGLLGQAMQAGAAGGGGLFGGGEGADVAGAVQIDLAFDDTLDRPGNEIRVVEDGDTLYLKGYVVSQFMRSHAQKIAEQAVKEAESDKKVVNWLMVRPAKAPARGRR
ncbi:MAG: BON domain-containing protein [Armatimonadota bacterium]